MDSSITYNVHVFMKKFSLLRRLNITTALWLVILTTGVSSTTLFAASTSNFQFTVNAGTLTVDIVNASYVTVGSPTVVFSPATFSFTCQTAGVTGTFGTTTQQIYVKNPDAADAGWSVSLAASAPTAFWDSTGTDVDFNDPTTSGCTDSADADSLSWQLTVNASGATLAAGARSGTLTTNITKGSSSGYVQGSVDSITLLTAAAGSEDIWDWTLQGVTLSQSIPAETPAASDYDINMTLSII